MKDKIGAGSGNEKHHKVSGQAKKFIKLYNEEFDPGSG